MLQVFEVQTEDQPFVDTVLCTPGPGEKTEHTITSSILMTPTPAAGVGAARVAAAVGHEWGKVSASLENFGNTDCLH
jgi:hypothetical protein